MSFVIERAFRNRLFGRTLGLEFYTPADFRQSLTIRLLNDVRKMQLQNIAIIIAFHNSDALCYFLIFQCIILTVVPISVVFRYSKLGNFGNTTSYLWKLIISVL